MRQVRFFVTKSLKKFDLIRVFGKYEAYVWERLGILEYKLENLRESNKKNIFIPKRNLRILYFFRFLTLKDILYFLGNLL